MTASMLALLVSGGCRTPGDPDASGSPSDPIVSREVQRDDHEPAPRTPTAAPSSAREPSEPSGLVAVTHADPTDACERVCGSLGDCLLADADPSASGLELECLDLCVNSAEPAAKQAFLDCEHNAECGPLRTCAEQRWAALAGSRKPAVAAPTADVASSCVEGCRWVFTCMLTNQPPGEGHLDPGFEAEILACETNCVTADREGLEKFDVVTKCLKERCPTGMSADCWGLFN